MVASLLPYLILHAHSQFPYHSVHGLVWKANDYVPDKTVSNGSKQFAMLIVQEKIVNLNFLEDCTW